MVTIHDVLLLSFIVLGIGGCALLGVLLRQIVTRLSWIACTLDEMYESDGVCEDCLREQHAKGWHGEMEEN